MENKIRVLQTAIENETKRLDAVEIKLYNVSVELKERLDRYKAESISFLNQRDALIDSMRSGNEYILRCRRELEELEKSK